MQTTETPERRKKETKQGRMVPGQFPDTTFTDGHWVDLPSDVVADGKWTDIEHSCRKYVPTNHRLVAVRIKVG